jgi:ribonuclease Z
MTVNSSSSVAERVCRFPAVLSGIFFLVLGIGFMTFPDTLATGFSVQPLSIQGLNALRGDFGGLFLGMGFFCFLGALRGKSGWLAVPIVFLLIIITGRAISLVFDGFFAGGGRSLIIEAFLVGLLSISALGLSRRGGSGEKGISEFFSTKILIVLILTVSAIGLLILLQKPIGTAMVRSLADQAVGTDAMSGLPDGLHVVLCGSGSPLADPRRASACTAVIAGQDLYLVDAGPGSERKLELMRINPGKIRAVFLSHFHSDHMGDLGEVILKRWSSGSRKEPVEVFGPEGVETVVAGFNQAYSLDSKYRISHHGPEVVPPEGVGGAARTFYFSPGKEETVICARDDLRVTAFPVEHAPVRPAVGYRFDYKGRSVVISGDTRPAQSLIRQSRGADLLVHEGLQPAMINLVRESARKLGRSGLARIMGDVNSYHTSPEDAAGMAEKAGVGHLLLTHIMPPLPTADLKPAYLGEAKKYFQGPITIAEDGLVISLPAGSKKIVKKMLL